MPTTPRRQILEAMQEAAAQLAERLGYDIGELVQFRADFDTATEGLELEARIVLARPTLYAYTPAPPAGISPSDVALFAESHDRIRRGRRQRRPRGALGRVAAEIDRARPGEGAAAAEALERAQEAEPWAELLAAVLRFHEAMTARDLVAAAEVFALVYTMGRCAAAIERRRYKPEAFAALARVMKWAGWTDAEIRFAQLELE